MAQTDVNVAKILEIVQRLEAGQSKPPVADTESIVEQLESGAAKLARVVAFKATLSPQEQAAVPDYWFADGLPVNTAQAGINLFCNRNAAYAALGMSGGADSRFIQAGNYKKVGAEAFETLDAGVVAPGKTYHDVLAIVQRAAKDGLVGGVFSVRGA